VGSLVFPTSAWFLSGLFGARSDYTFPVMCARTRPPADVLAVALLFFCALRVFEVFRFFRVEGGLSTQGFCSCRRVSLVFKGSELVSFSSWRRKEKLFAAFLFNCWPSIRGPSGRFSPEFSTWSTPLCFFSLTFPFFPLPPVRRYFYTFNFPLGDCVLSSFFLPGGAIFTPVGVFRFISLTGRSLGSLPFLCYV